MMGGQKIKILFCGSEILNVCVVSGTTISVPMFIIDGVIVINDLRRVKHKKYIYNDIFQRIINFQNLLS